MKKDFVVDKKYLNIPVCAQKEEKLLRVFLLDEEGKEEEKFTEVMVPVDAEQEEEYVCDFYAQIPLPAYQGRKIRVSMKEGDAPESFLAAVFFFRMNRRKQRTRIRSFILRRTAGGPMTRTE